MLLVRIQSRRPLIDGAWSNWQRRLAQTQNVGGSNPSAPMFRGSSSVAESRFAIPLVAGPIPASRSKFRASEEKVGSLAITCKLRHGWCTEKRTVILFV